MSKNDIAFDIAELLDLNWTNLLKKAETAHGKCPTSIKGQLKLAFWHTYSPNSWMEEDLEKYRVINNAFVWVNHWHIQRTYISGFMFRQITQHLTAKSRLIYKQWMKTKAKK